MNKRWREHAQFSTNTTTHLLLNTPFLFQQTPNQGQDVLQLAIIITTTTTTTVKQEFLQRLQATT
jgi:hypothetical protein